MWGNRGFGKPPVSQSTGVSQGGIPRSPADRPPMASCELGKSAASGQNGRMGFHLVRYSLLGHVGRFASVDANRYPRQTRVIVRSPRGLEIGEVLAPPSRARRPRRPRAKSCDESRSKTTCWSPAWNSVATRPSRHAATCCRPRGCRRCWSTSNTCSTGKGCFSTFWARSPIPPRGSSTAWPSRTRPRSNSANSPRRSPKVADQAAAPRKPWGRGAAPVALPARWRVPAGRSGKPARAGRSFFSRTAILPNFRATPEIRSSRRRRGRLPAARADSIPSRRTARASLTRSSAPTVAPP